MYCTRRSPADVQPPLGVILKSDLHEFKALLIVLDTEPILILMGTDDMGGRYRLLVIRHCILRRLLSVSYILVDRVGISVEQYYKLLYFISSERLYILRSRRCDGFTIRPRHVRFSRKIVYIAFCPSTAPRIGEFGVDIQILVKNEGIITSYHLTNCDKHTEIRFRTPAVRCVHHFVNAVLSAISRCPLGFNQAKNSSS